MSSFIFFFSLTHKPLQLSLLMGRSLQRYFIQQDMKGEYFWTLTKTPFQCLAKFWGFLKTNISALFYLTVVDRLYFYKSCKVLPNFISSWKTSQITKYHYTLMCNRNFKHIVKHIVRVKEIISFYLRSHLIQKTTVRVITLINVNVFTHKILTETNKPCILLTFTYSNLIGDNHFNCKNEFYTIKCKPLGWDSKQTEGNTFSVAIITPDFGPGCSSYSCLKNNEENLGQDFLKIFTALLSCSNYYIGLIAHHFSLQ